MNLRKSDYEKNRLKILSVQCSLCGTCCREPVPVVTHKDISRLIRATGLSPGRFTSLYASVDFDDDNYWIRMSYGRRLLGLRKTGGKCIFLSEDNRCTVYDSRPMSCRIYPYQVYLDEQNELEDIQLQESVRTQVNCRFRRDGHNSLGKIRRLSRQDNTESESYQRKVLRWNRHFKDGRKAEFLSFLGFKNR